jgi:regulator of protease activity HflC (stomatin/prohibitin superfamily)
LKERGEQIESIVVPFTDGIRSVQVAANLKKAVDSSGCEVFKAFEKTVVLALIDDAWKEHLREMDDLKQSVQNAVYELSDFEQQIQSYIFNEIRAEVPKKELDQVYENKEDIENAVKKQLSGALEKYGYVIQNALVVDIAPDKGVKEAMNRINSAARDRKAAEEQGEAAKILIVKAAEAEAESKKLQGKGTADQRDAIIKGFQESIEAFSKNTGINQADVMRFVEITQYFDTMRDIAKDNNNVIFMPHSSTGSGVIEEYAAASIASNKIDDNKNKTKLLKG